MGEEVQIIEVFPGLKNDPDFKITSPYNPDYNCIAWAYHYDNRWMWPGGVDKKTVDGFRFWPEGVEDTTDVAAFIEAFRKKGYEVCSNSEFEDGFRKIALYVKPGTTECTHAARQLRSGKWTSKLGRSQDIQHGTPYSIEGDVYGVVHCIMKVPFK